MADIIKCPVCGESNLPDQEFCQYCQSRLQPLTGNLKGADAPIKPGQAPTKKNTAELEPILPQWLRDARDSARKSAEDEAAQAGRQPQESFSAPASSSSDLLAGLHSQAGSEEEETPDWLANITGAAPKAKKPQADSPEVRWVELGGAKDFAQEESDSESFIPSWLEGITPTEPQREEKDELSDWFKQTDDSLKPQKPATQAPPFDISFSDSAPSQPADSGDTPDWLKKMAADSAQSNDALFSDSTETSNVASSGDTPDWLRQMAADTGEQKSDINAAPADAPDWLHQMVADDQTQNDNAPFLSAGSFDAPAAEPMESIDAPDWLRAMGGSQDHPQDQSADLAGISEAGIGEKAANENSPAPIPDWMKDFPSVENERPSQSATPAWLKEEKPASSAGEVPAWLSNTQSPAQEQSPAQDEASFGDIPSWLKAAAPQSSVYEGTSAEPVPPATTPSSDSPDWLNAFKSIDTPEPPQAPTAFPSNTPFESAPPAFTPDSQTNIDALFADMPDWLSTSTDVPPVPSPSSSTPAANTDATITPGELPSWVQAMRPVDTGAAAPRSSSTSLSSDQTLESRGALAGLQGVLPSVPGYTPTSKPKAYSIKLQASEEQQAHATLLEQILAAETEPVPIASFSALTPSRIMRWFLTVALFAVLIAALFLRTKIFLMPIGVPPEINGAMQVAQSIPQGAPVLVAFDYEPARSGEMEAAAAPLFNLLRQPNFTFISTNETGAILAERFISQPFADTDHSGFNVLNLGYLPGGQMGIRAFAQAPQDTAPQLAGIASLSQFTALILITDSADSARAWIEQISSMHSTIPILVISSAQAAPMIQPYYESQQVSGLVSGLYGGAVLEQNTKPSDDGTPGITRTYWDSYSLGMLLAMVLIVGGGLWNLVLGLQNRSAMGDAK